MTYIVTSEFDLNKIAAPNLPLATEEYSRFYQDQFNNVLRLYFNRLDNLIGQLKTGSGAIDGSGLRLPYGAFSDFTDQTTTINTATLMGLSVTDFSNGVSLTTGSKITVANPGIYNLQFSAQLQNLDNAPQDVFIWLKQNGTDIVGSTGLVGMPARKSAGVPFHDIKGWNYYLSMNVNDYVQIYWSTTNVDVTIQTYAASGTPTKPSTASVVATLSFVSALPT
tara:strand:+ start:60 stop:728 length:669 start_codon:yes stop_codon:yes gene_type:complete